jgi:hypothetical protein
VNTTPTLTKEHKKLLRNKIFRHLEGIPLSAVIRQLSSKGVLDHIGKEWTDLQVLTAQFSANEGYLNVALRLLCSQGWLEQRSENCGTIVKFRRTELGDGALKHTSAYDGQSDFYEVARSFVSLFKDGFDADSLNILKKHIESFEADWSLQGIDAELTRQISRHREGPIAGAILVQLGMSGFIDGLESNALPKLESLSGDHWPLIYRAIRKLGWSAEENGVEVLTDEGQFMFKRASAYGVTVSYLQTFCWLDELLFGKGNALWDKPLDTPEIHVDRTMNVWGSGGAHSTYFRKIDEIVTRIFNLPIEEQPKGIADMGCGNGAFLEHLYHLIKTQTKRGQMLDEHPLLIVGSDFNEAALVSSKTTLDAAGIDAHLLHGDIGDPDALAQDLKQMFGVDLGEVLNVRSFLDHNRIFQAPDSIDEGRTAHSTGAFAFRGRRLPNTEVEQNLFNHFTKWLPYVQKFGLLVIELHTIRPEIAAQNLGVTAITAYDGTHGFTDQYIVEHDVFLAIAKEAGLTADPACHEAYPPGDLTTVSINLLKN